MRSPAKARENLFAPVVCPAHCASLEQYYRLRRQPPLYTSYSLYTLETNASFSHASASLELKYHPRPLRQTLTETVAWLRSQGRLPAVTC